MDCQTCVKLILVGPSGAGKTSLISCFLRGQAEPDALPTVAPAFSNATITVQSGVVDLQIWDTAGQEKYVSVSQIFYRDSHVAFVCYEPGHPEVIEPWINRVREQVPTCAIILVATKADLLTDQERLALFNQSLNLVQVHNAKSHFITSSISGLNISELFYGAAESGKKPDVVIKQVMDITHTEEPSHGCC
jgi:small GTP-binding protein